MRRGHHPHRPERVRPDRPGDRAQPRGALSPVEAIVRARQALLDYAEQGLASHHDPHTEEGVNVDWSATVEQGQGMIDGPDDYTSDLDAALDEQ